MVSIVIRNKNEATSLENILSIITSVYQGDYAEIIVVDNCSTDNSVEIANKYNCKVIYITNFSYGRATNLGIESAVSKYVLLLSSHAIPVGNSFFKNTLNALNNFENVAGIRYINSIENYKRAVKNNFLVVEPLKYGLMTGCALVSKKVWEKFKFNENLVFSEDKEWSERVVQDGFQILDLNETFFYFIKRNGESSLVRYKNETISDYQLHNKEFPTRLVIVASFLNKFFYTNIKDQLQLMKQDILILKTKFEIYKKLKEDGEN